MRVKKDSLDEQLAGVSFLICTYNSASRIQETLACLARQVPMQGVSWEVILVENACTDDTVNQAESYWKKTGSDVPLRIFSESRAGKNFAVQLAFDQARYRYACIVDDDNRLASNYLQVGYALLETHPQIGVLGGQNTGVFEVEPPAWFPAFQACYAVGIPTGGQGRPLTDGNIGNGFLWGAGMYVRISLWNQLQVLDFKSLFIGRQGNKKLTAGEDDEICYVAQLLGYEVWYSSNLKLEHYMTKNRLNSEYRNRLFYSTIRATSRLNAYRSIVDKKSAVSTALILNAVKDFIYMTRGTASYIARNIFKASVGRDELVIMNCRHKICVFYDYLKSFPKVVSYYRSIDKLKQKARNASLQLQ